MGKYHDKIMNLQASGFYRENGDTPQQAFRQGHKLARHSAAELSNEADTEISALRKLAEKLWLVTHQEFCTNMTNCTSFEGGVEPCMHPRPELLK